MIKRLTKHGNSLAVVIEKPILELLKITSDTPLEVSTDGSRLILSPVSANDRRSAFDEVLAKVNQRHGEVLKKLAE
jgi:antitoxin component of MazEF toxin-antitoxin module